MPTDARGVTRGRWPWSPPAPVRSRTPSPRSGCPTYRAFARVFARRTAMSATRERFGERARKALFVAFAACTLWLVVENSILLVVLTRGWAVGHAVNVEARHDRP